MNILKIFFKNGRLSDTSEQNSDFPLQRYENGDRYIGEMKDGLRNGVGTYIFANGDRYEGFWKNNVKHGQGKYYYKSGELYIGKWADNKKKGMGKYFYNNQERYVGMFEDDKKHGQGTQFHADGSWYRGTYVQGKKHGAGQLHEKNAIHEEYWNLGNLESKRKINDVTEDQHDLQGEEEETRVNEEIKQEENLSQNKNQERSSKKPSQRLEREQSTCINEIDIPNVATLDKDSDQAPSRKSSNSGSNSSSARSKPNLETQQVSEKNNSVSYSQNNQWDSMFKSIIDKKNFDSKYDSSRSDQSETIEQLASMELVTKDNLMTKLVTKWTKEDVSMHLSHIGFAKFVQAFYENNITGMVLFDLTDEDLKEEFQMNLGERKLFLRSMKCLRKMQKHNMSQQDIINCENFRKCFNNDANSKIKVKKMRSLSSTKLDRGIKMKEIEEEKSSSEDEQAQGDKNLSIQNKLHITKQRLKQQLKENKEDSDPNQSSSSDSESSQENNNQGEFLEDNLQESSESQVIEHGVDNPDKIFISNLNQKDNLAGGLSREHSQTKKRSISTISVMSSVHSHSYADIEEEEEDEEKKELDDLSSEPLRSRQTTKQDQNNSFEKVLEAPMPIKDSVMESSNQALPTNGAQNGSGSKIILTNREPIKIRTPKTNKIRKQSSNSQYQSHSHHESHDQEEAQKKLKKNKKSKELQQQAQTPKRKVTSTSRDVSPQSQNSIKSSPRSLKQVIQKSATKVMIEEILDENPPVIQNVPQTSSQSQSSLQVMKQSLKDHIKEQKSSPSQISLVVPSIVSQKSALFQSQQGSNENSVVDEDKNSNGSRKNTLQDINYPLLNNQENAAPTVSFQNRVSEIQDEEQNRTYRSQSGNQAQNQSQTKQSNYTKNLLQQYQNPSYSTSSSDESSSDSEEEKQHSSFERKKNGLSQKQISHQPQTEVGNGLNLTKSKSATVSKKQKQSEIKQGKNTTNLELDGMGENPEDKREKKKKKAREFSNDQIQEIIQKFLDKEKLDTFIIDSKDLIWSSEDKIGAGGYGEVYKGIYLGQEVAVKQYGKKQARFNQRKAFDLLSEVQVINNLRHPNIVLYMGVCINTTHYLMINEYLEQGSLFDHLHIKKSMIDSDRILYIIEDIALGMAYLHGRSVLHCDLKSPNVLVDQSWNVKLCDFGLSRIRNKLKKGRKRKKNGKIGTVQWMAPEVMREEEYTNKSDVYSFGMILWELLTRKIPYYSWSHVQITGTVGYHDNFPLEVPFKGNPELIQLMKQCLNRDPEQRPPFKDIVEYIQNISKKGKSSHRKVVKDLVLFFGD